MRKNRASASRYFDRDVRAGTELLNRGLCPNDGEPLVTLQDTGDEACHECGFVKRCLPANVIDARAAFNRRWQPALNSKTKVYT